jgi:hypothetical protein
MQNPKLIIFLHAIREKIVDIFFRAKIEFPGISILKHRRDLLGIDFQFSKYEPNIFIIRIAKIYDRFPFLY